MSSSDLSQWTQMTPHAPWSARFGSIVESFNNTLVVIGGDHGYSYQKDNEVWLSWSNGANWTLVTVAGFNGRSDAISEIIGQNLYIAGGENNMHTNDHVDSEVWSTQIDFSPPAEDPTPPTPEPTPDPIPYAKWDLVNSNAWQPRASGISAYFPPLSPQQPGRWLVIGGFTRVNWTDQALHDAWTSDDLGVTWQQASAYIPFIQVEMAADTVTTPTGTTLIVSGGVDFVSYTSYNNIYRSDDRGASFQLVTAQAAWPVRTAHGMVTVNKGLPTQMIVIIGGYQYQHGFPTMLNDVRRTGYARTWLAAAA
jgi:hypothetical protein